MEHLFRFTKLRKLLFNSVKQKKLSGLSNYNQMIDEGPFFFSGICCHLELLKAS